jgi:hypothetical protein
MHMKKHWWWFVLPLVIAPLAMTSTVTCGCEPDPTTIAGQMGIYRYPGEELLPAAQNQAIGRRNLVGRSMDNLVNLENGRAMDPECKQVGSVEIRCSFWNEQGILQSKGRAVRIRADEKGKVIDVSVEAIRKIHFLPFSGEV